MAVTGDRDVEGFVMGEQVKPMDCRARQARSIGEVPNDLLDEVLSTLGACIY